MATRDELLVALAARYRGGGREEKTRILALLWQISLKVAGQVQHHSADIAAVVAG